MAAGFDGALSLKDDAAVLAVEAGRELVVTTDTIVEGVHYIGNETPDFIARKLLRV
ncbi:MAG: AIR synthase related protein, partial [Pseudomonadota bacterium]|nr:AIR synthase related protein [Pseudomonadota bacterium]